MSSSPPSSSAAARPVLVLWGTETYTAEGLAQQAGKALKKAGYDVKVQDIEQVDAEALAAAGTALIVTSTYGNGDPPANAEPLHGALMAADAPRLDGLRFSVCGLGDTTYPRFAQCGKDFDQRMAELGGLRFAARADCDVDYEPPFAAWLQSVLGGLAELPWGEGLVEVEGEGEADAAPAPAEVDAPDVVVEVAAPSPAAAPSPVFLGPPARAGAPLGSRRNPGVATVLESRPETRPGASREVRHLRLDLRESGVSYAAGDSLAVWAPNDPKVVDAVLAAGRLDPDALVSVGEGPLVPLSEALSFRLGLGLVDPRLADHIVSRGGRLAQPYDNIDTHVIDLVRAAGVQLDAEVLVKCLRPLAPRLYSIASSPLVRPGEADLLASVVRYEAFGHTRSGVATGWMADRLPVGGRLGVYLQAAPHFRLPADDVPVIMIGPGTGVAPFRAFLQERAARGATGKNWLVFGSRSRDTDFLYQAELESAVAEGRLHRLDLAFSRDPGVARGQNYVQHKLLHNAAELWAWLEAGASIYVCGDAKQMAPDVHQTLRDIAAKQGGMSAEAAAEHIKGLSQAGRYLRDVY